MNYTAGAAVAAFFMTAAAAYGAPPPLVLAPSHAPAPTAMPRETHKTAQTVGPDLLFSQGEFEQARTAYQAVPKSNPQYEEAQRQLGAIALFQNHLGDAQAKLEGALSRNPADQKAAALLAETMERADQFADMVPLLRQVKRPERVAEFSLFGKSVPYRIASRQKSATVPFEWTEPLPVVNAKVNGVEGLFLIDTGAPEIVLDPQYATDAKLQTTPNSGPGTSFGRIARFALGSLETDDVPAMLIDLRGMSALARRQRIAGVIGVEFLSHFRTTLDYVHDRLILEPQNAPPQGGSALAEIPFWFMGDHFLVAPGRLDRGPKQLFFVDTGIGSFVFTAPDSTLRDAGIPVPTPPARTSARAPVAPPSFPIASLSLGDLKESKLTGIYGSFPPPLENGLGVHVGGIVSHGFFHNYTVTFDFVRMTVRVRK